SRSARSMKAAGITRESSALCAEKQSHMRNTPKTLSPQSDWERTDELCTSATGGGLMQAPPCKPDCQCGKHNRTKMHNELIGRGVRRDNEEKRVKASGNKSFVRQLRQRAEKRCRRSESIKGTRQARNHQNAH